MRQRAIAIAALLLAANIICASCSRKGRRPIVAPADPSKGAFPLWAAVNGSSTYAVLVDVQVALQVPLLQLGAGWLRSKAEGAGLNYDGLADALGFDPILDVEELFVTDAGEAYPGREKSSQILVLRYSKDVANLDVVLKLVGATGGTAVDKRPVRGRDVFFFEENHVAILSLDATTVVVLRGFGPDDVDTWLEETTRPCDVRERAFADVGERIDDPSLGPREHRFLSAWVDFIGLKNRFGVGEPAAEGIQAPVPIDDLRAMMESADTMVVHASYSGRLAILQQAGFTSEEGARVAADAVREFKQKFAEGPPVPLVGDLLSQVTDTLEVQVEGSALLARWEIPEAVLDAATALVGLFVGMAEAMKEQPGGPPPGPGFPIPLPRLPEAPGGPPPGI